MLDDYQAQFRFELERAKRDDPIEADKTEQIRWQKLYRDLQKSDVREYKQDIDFGSEVFSVLSGKANELNWFVFEQQVRTQISDLTDSTEKKCEDILHAFKRQTSEFEVLKKKILTTEEVV